MSAPPESHVVRVAHDGARASATLERHGWEIEMAAGSGRLDVATGRLLLGRVVEQVAEAGGGTARWRIPSPTAEHDRIAAAHGFSGDRGLVQMRRPLPAPRPGPPLATRPFVAGVDDEEWLRVNNAAFDWHPEQGGWGPAELAARLDEEWVDPTGFLLHPADDDPSAPPGSPIDGFCWTKVHADLDPPVGEIFVIAVDPSAAGTGLGRRLVLAGLAHLHDAGTTEAMLYTELDNTAARRTYDRLDFRVHHDVRVYERDVPDAGQTPTPTAEPIP